ncbi:MAG: hypothetical protein Q8N55_02150 [bacterium]|nr:hypothetical protein [bacterium]
MIQSPIIIKWLKWHYIDAFKGILNAWGNFLWFNLEHFSVKGLLKSLFSHWRGDKSSYGRGFDLRVFLTSLLFNLISRILGAIMRTIVILFALILEGIIFGLGVVILLVWLLLPFSTIITLFYLIGVFL